MHDSLCSQPWVGERVAQVVNFQQAVTINLQARKQVASTSLARQRVSLLKQLATSLAAVRQVGFFKGTVPRIVFAVFSGCGWNLKSTSAVMLAPRSHFEEICQTFKPLSLH